MQKRKTNFFNADHATRTLQNSIAKQPTPDNG